MTTLRHHLVDAQGKPIIAHPASVTPYVPAPSGTYQRAVGVRAVSDGSGWISWQLPLVPNQDAPIYYVTGISADPVVIQVPSTATDVLVDDVRISTVGLFSQFGIHPSAPPSSSAYNDPFVTETELANRMSGLAATDVAMAAAWGPATAAKAAADPVLRAALDARLTIASVATANTTATADTYLPVNASSGAITITLPTGQAKGATIVVEKEDASTNIITMSGSLRGSAGTIALVWPFESVTLVADATGSWWPRAGHKTKTSLDAAYAPSANPAFSGTVALPGGGNSARRPVNGSAVIDGAVSRTLPGDKVAYSFAATIKGGFSGDTGGNPTFAWGANDFIITGSTAGDVAGVNNLTARETEIHLATPSAAVTNMKGLQVDCIVESAATSATVSSMFGVYITPLAKNAATATVTNAYGIYVEAPTAATTNYGLYVNGASQFVGNVTLAGTSALTVSGALTAGSASTYVKSIANTPNQQGAAVGAYLGSAQGAALELADGTNTIRIDNNGSGTLRVLKAGVQSNFEIDLSGNTKMKGGPGFYNTPPVAAKPTVSGSRAGNAALASLLTTLASFGLLTDGTTA